jgi:tetratricopeptide (TPR) repeat protein
MNQISLIAIFCCLAFCAIAQDFQSLLNEGIELHDAGKYQEAINKYKKALAIDPASALVYYEMAYSYHQLKDYTNALECVNKSLSFNDEKTNYLATIVKGSVLDDMGEPKESIAFYQQALKKYPDEYLLLFNYGVSLAGVRRISEAEQSFKSALALNPNHPGSHLQLANLKMSKNENVSALCGLYFFLLLESEGPRAETNSKKLLSLLYPEKKGKENEWVINLSGKPDKNDPITAAELGLTMIQISSGDLEGKNKTQQENLVKDTDSLLTLLGELNENNTKRKKKKATTNEHLWNFYVPFFYELHKSGHTEAFSYHIMKSSQDESVQDWLAANNEKLQLFYLWLETN